MGDQSVAAPISIWDICAMAVGNSEIASSVLVMRQDAQILWDEKPRHFAEKRRFSRQILIDRRPNSRR
jgi:hypothetical protein